MTALADLLLLPAPRALEGLAGTVAVPTPLTASANPALDGALASGLGGRPWQRAARGWAHCAVGAVEGGPEGYELVLRPGDGPQALITAATPLGARHGLRTLAQLLAQGAVLPALRIADAPAFAVRGAMLDVSRDRVPTMAELERTVALLASLKINHLQLYTEHAFAYAGHEEVWRDASPITPDELRRLDAFCAAHGIELAANQNCFGHLTRWLDHPRYRPLAELTGDWDFNGFARSGPFSLCPLDPGSLALVEDLLAQLTPCVASSLVNIGCDETYDVGQGRSKAEVARRGRAAVYLDFLAQVCAVVRRHGRRPAFWGDIALEHPEALDRLPADVVALAWGYEPDAPFARWCTQLQARETWVCPGTSSWRAITGRTSERRANLMAAARDGLAGGARGYLVTDWGDLGHRQQWPIALAGLAEGAHRAWSGTAAYDARAASLHAFADRSLSVATWLDAFGDVDRDLRAIGGRPRADGSPAPLRNSTALFVDLHKPLAEPWIGDDQAWRAVSARLHALPPPDPLVTGLDVQLWRECRHAWRTAAFAAARAICRRSGEREAFPLLAGTLRALIEEHRELWLARSRPGGLDDSCAWYRATLAELERT